MISVEEALDRCLALVSPLPVESVPLAAAAGRVMRSAAAAALDQPPFDASAMDGYAVAGDPAPGAVFRVTGEAGAGHAYDGTVGAGEAVRIFTGAPVPAGADRVVIQEDVEVAGDSITLKDGADAGPHIRPRGQDFHRGATLPPRRLRPNDLALLAAMNVPQVTVTRRPVVAIIATGDELVMPGETPRPDQIIASNAFALKAMVEAGGAIGRILPIARDTADSLKAVLALASDADLVVTIGGASVGDHDVVGRAAAELGIERAFWRIAMRPGKPLLAGRLKGVPLLGLPGNPVSSIVCAQLFLMPMVRALLGEPAAGHGPRRAILGADVLANGARVHFMRARLAEGDRQPVITPFDRQDSALLSILAEANALLIRPIGDAARTKGTVVDYLPM